MTYIFYDTETTGKVTAFDQILQFAAIKSDAELNVLDTFDVRCRLLPYIVPSPGALLVTGATVADLIACPLSHFEMMRQVHAKMHRWSEGGAIFVGWNSMKFDETLLRQAYYQSLLPVYQTNTNGNGRADMMRMAQVVFACAPNVLAVPVTAEGKRAFRLGLMAAANNIALDHAHDALADAAAALGIARLIRQRAPALWDALMETRARAVPCGCFRANRLCCSAKPSAILSTALSRRLRPMPATPTRSPFSISRSTPRRISTPAMPICVRRSMERPGSSAACRSMPNRGFCRSNTRRMMCKVGGNRMRTYQARVQAIRAHPEFCRRISRLLAARYADQVEQVLCRAAHLQRVCLERRPDAHAFISQPGLGRPCRYHPGDRGPALSPDRATAHSGRTPGSAD